jgi:hypothetical protein
MIIEIVLILILIWVILRQRRQNRVLRHFILPKINDLYDCFEIVDRDIADAKKDLRGEIDALKKDLGYLTKKSFKI